MPGYEYNAEVKPTSISISNAINVIIITRTKPAFGWQGLAGHWVKIQIKTVLFWVFSTSHFAPAALSSDLNQPGTINDDKNPPGAIKKNMKNHLEP